MSHAAEQTQPIEQADQLPPMTAEAARRLAALLAPHLLAMRAVTAGTRYGTCAGADADPAADHIVVTSTGAGSAAAVQQPPATAATQIFIAGMLERISAA